VTDVADVAAEEVAPVVEEPVVEVGDDAKVDAWIPPISPATMRDCITTATEQEAWETSVGTTEAYAIECAPMIGPDGTATVKVANRMLILLVHKGNTILFLLPFFLPFLWQTSGNSGKFRIWVDLKESSVGW
jgi:hypothetical protein